MIRMEIDVAELEAIERRIAIFEASRRGAFKTMLRDIGEGLVEREKQRIDDQYDPDGQPWAPWSPNYTGNKLLNKTGRMRESFRSKRTAKSVRVDNTAPYFKFHQKGTRNMPARPVLGWGPEEIDIAVDQGLKMLQEAFQ